MGNCFFSPADLKPWEENPAWFKVLLKNSSKSFMSASGNQEGYLIPGNGVEEPIEDSGIVGFGGWVSGSSGPLLPSKSCPPC